MKPLITTISSIQKAGDSLKQIIFYWFPELISSLMLMVLPQLFDAYIISNSQTTAAYGALALAASCIHFLVKFAEVIPVAAIAIIGRHNGAQRYTQCGKDFINTFWVSLLLGTGQFVLIYIGVGTIYRLLGASSEVMALGKTYLQLRSFGVLLIFVSLAFLGFMRAVKNTKIPMLINIIGIIAYIFFDYVLVLGKWGFPMMNLTGSALATIIQYGIMNVTAIAYLALNTNYHKYFAEIFLFKFDFRQMGKLLNLSWPIMLDKLSFAFSFIWLVRLVNNIDINATAACNTIIQLQRLALLPALAFAQVMTFLVSNRLGANDLSGAIANIKKVLFLTFVTTTLAFLFLTLKTSFFITSFDPHGHFTELGSFALPYINLLALFDCIQAILASTLRGAGDVRAVMMTRFFCTVFFFMPLSLGISLLPIENSILKFVLLYNSLYLSTALMSLFFCKRIISGKWKQQKL